MRLTLLSMTLAYFAIALPANATILADGSSSLATRATTIGSVSFTATWLGSFRVTSEAVSVDTRRRGMTIVVR